MDQDKTINVILLKVGQVMYNGQARALSSVDPQGPFDILPYHTNFIALIKKHIVIYPEHGGKQIIPIDSGILRASKDRVEIFLGITVDEMDTKDIVEKKDFFTKMIEEEQLKPEGDTVLISSKGRATTTATTAKKS